eukprot:11971769-Ditylum_brightwellii.AAC.1
MDDKESPPLLLRKNDKIFKDKESNEEEEDGDPLGLVQAKKQRRTRNDNKEEEEALALVLRRGPGDMTLVDACNSFNELSHLAMLWK